MLRNKHFIFTKIFYATFCSSTLTNSHIIAKLDIPIYHFFSLVIISGKIFVLQSHVQFISLSLKTILDSIHELCLLFENNEPALDLINLGMNL